MVTFRVIFLKHEISTSQQFIVVVM